MKQLITTILLFSALVGNVFAQSLSPYYSIGSVDGNVDDITANIEQALATEGFVPLGNYTPGNNTEHLVLVFTHPKLEKIALSYTDRGALAVALKVALRTLDGKVEVSYMNPEYMFNAYFRKDIERNESDLKNISDTFKITLNALGSKNKPFGGSVKHSDLQKYQYMWGMPYFTDPVKLKTFDSFEEGVATIQKNLSAAAGETVMVYQRVYNSNKVAVWGVGFNDAKKGEAKFLPIIGEQHLAAMPYDIILQGNNATILHGRYRVALYWPELTMGTFTKIMSTPGDIENMMKTLVE